MQFSSTPQLRADVLAACRVLTHFRAVEAFGHVSARVSEQRIIVTPRRALGLVTEPDLVEMDLEGHKLAGEAGPPLEVAMHLAVYRRRPDVMAIVRAHPRHVAAYACAGEPLRIGHAFGADLGAFVPLFPQPFLIISTEIAESVADTLGDSAAMILRSNGMLAVGHSVPHACVQTLFMEETAEMQLLAHGAGFGVQFYSPEEAARRHKEDLVNEPVRAWEYYLAVAEGRLAWNR